jgi:hypothetical protein
LEQIKSSFEDVGGIYKKGKILLNDYSVRSVKDLAVIINHFDKFPLLTQKRADFELFKIALDLMKHKEHLTIEGIHKLIAIKASMNLGLSEDLKVAFPNTHPVPRPVVENQEIKDPH